VLAAAGRPAALVVAGAVLATLGAVVFHEQGFTFTTLPGFDNRWMPHRQSVAYVHDDQSGRAAEELPEQRANGVPRDDRNDGVRHKDKRDQSPEFHLARLADD
jgi:hypothetical protein